MNKIYLIMLSSVCLASLGWADVPAKYVDEYITVLTAKKELLSIDPYNVPFDQPRETIIFDHLKEFPDLPPHPRSQYGGMADTRFKATGHIYTKKIGKRWWFVDPDGHLMVHRAVNCLSSETPNGEKETAAWAALFGNEPNSIGGVHGPKWAAWTSDLLADLDFNGSSGWGSKGSRAIRRIGRNIVYIQHVYVDTYGDGANKRVSCFEPGWQDWMESKIKSAANEEVIPANGDQPAVKAKDDPCCLGIFTSNEGDYGTLDSLIEYLSQNPTKVTWSTYVNINAEAVRWLNEQGITQFQAGVQYDTAVLEAAISPELRKAFMVHAWETYYSAVKAAIVKYMPNKLYCGERYKSDNAFKELYEVYGKYVDVASINRYPVWEESSSFMDGLEGWADKPWFPTEFYCKGHLESHWQEEPTAGSGDDADGMGQVAAYQVDRGHFYQARILSTIQHGSAAGFHWFRFQDPRGQGYTNKGIVTRYYVDALKGNTSGYTYEPLFTNMTDLMRQVNTRIYRLIEYFDGIDYTQVTEIMPVTITATPAAGSVTLNWNAALDWEGNQASNITYNVYRRLDPNGKLGVPTATNLTASTYIDLNVDPGTTYYYQVVPVDFQGILWEASNALAVQTPGTAPAFLGKTLRPVADGYVKGGDYSNRNYGTEDKLDARSANSLEGKTTSLTYLRFDLSTVGPIEHAVLRLKTKGTGALLWWEIAKGHGWDDSTLTWDNQPVVIDTVGQQYDKPAGEWVEFDVSQAANEMGFGDKQLVIGIRSVDGETCSFYSREAAFVGDRPLLLINGGDGSENYSMVTSFTLVNADTDLPVPGFDPIADGAVINKAAIGISNLNIRANTTPDSDFGSVVFSLSGATAQSSTDNALPWALFGDASGDFASGVFSNGMYTLTATPYDKDGGSGNANQALTIQFTITNEQPLAPIQIDFLTLRNGNTGEVVPGYETVANTIVIDTSATGTAALDIRASATPSNDFGYVLFELTGAMTVTHTDQQPEWDLLATDLPGGKWSNGGYTLTVTPYDTNDVAGTALSINITVHGGYGAPEVVFQDDFEDDTPLNTTNIGLGIRDDVDGAGEDVADVGAGYANLYGEYQIRANPEQNGNTSSHVLFMNQIGDGIQDPQYVDGGFAASYPIDRMEVTFDFYHTYLTGTKLKPDDAVRFYLLGTDNSSVESEIQFYRTGGFTIDGNTVSGASPVINAWQRFTGTFVATTTPGLVDLEWTLENLETSSIASGTNSVNLNNGAWATNTIDSTMANGIRLFVYDRDNAEDYLAYFDNVSVSARVPLPEDSSPEGYSTWAANHGVTGGLDDDDDGDGQSNKAEFYFGGNPTNSVDQSHMPQIAVVSQGGSNTVQFVYRKLAQVPASSVYQVEHTENLLNPAWSNIGVVVVGQGAVEGDSGYLAVTNEVSLIHTNGFVRLIVTEE